MKNEAVFTYSKNKKLGLRNIHRQKSSSASPKTRYAMNITKMVKTNLQEKNAKTTPPTKTRCPSTLKVRKKFNSVLLPDSLMTTTWSETIKSQKTNGIRNLIILFIPVSFFDFYEQVISEIIYIIIKKFSQKLIYYLL